MNGAEIVVQEINRSQAWVDTLSVVQYLPEMRWYLKNEGAIDAFRLVVEAMIARSVGCTDAYYQIGSHTMDLYGLGNVMYGFHTEWVPGGAVHAYADLKQWEEDRRFDFPSDSKEIDWGRAIASSYAGINPVAILSLIPPDFIDSK